MVARKKHILKINVKILDLPSSFGKLKKREADCTYISDGYT
jgi:hypothetical protein